MAWLETVPVTSTPSRYSRTEAPLFVATTWWKLVVSVIVTAETATSPPLDLRRVIRFALLIMSSQAELRDRIAWFAVLETVLRRTHASAVKTSPTSNVGE